jgi:two-component sensor histidine kinase
LLTDEPGEARTYAGEVLQPHIRGVLEPVVEAYRLEAEEQLAEDVGEVVSDTEAVKRILIVTSLVALALAVALALGLWRAISGPLAALREAAARIGDGELDTRVSVQSTDELGTLAGSFNLMAERLSESTVSIEKLNTVEEELRVSLGEKELLLKEVHHRVKNNLQIVSSLIDLQSSHIEDPDTLALFAESRSRIHSMALIHEQLYRSTDMDRIDFETYIELLVSGLARSVSVSPHVNIRTDVRPFRLDIDRAVACGLIVNELVTNAIKHAFPPDATGEIEVRFGCEQGDVCELVVSDNGTGIEPGREMSDSLGMELVESLVGQLGGEMVVSSNGGSRFCITFPAAAEERQ